MNQEKPINQCDGCRRGLPLDQDGFHHDPDSNYDFIGCTKDRYSKQTTKGKDQCPQSKPHVTGAEK